MANAQQGAELAPADQQVEQELAPVEMRPRPRVGGPWEDFLSMTKESINKLLRQSVPKTRSARLSWLVGHQEVDTEQQVTKFKPVDLFALALAVLSSPLVIVAYPVLVVLALPGLIVLRVYLGCLKRPSNDLHANSNSFSALSVLLWVLTLPFFAVVLVFGLVVFPTMLLMSAIYSVISFKFTFFGKNMELLRSCNRWPKCVWRDCVSAIAGTMDRQGFAKMALKLPSAFVVVPVLKYLFGANPLLYKLSVRYRNMWTSPFDVQDEKAIAAVVQAVSWPLIATNLAEPEDEDHPQEQRVRGCYQKPALQCDRIVSGHIPFPSEDRDARSVLAVLTSNGVVTFASAEHNVNGSIFHSMTAKRSIYNLRMYTWNPCHFLTGYVEVNLQHDGGIEQPMWCIVGDNYIGNWLFECADALLWHFDPAARSRVSLASTLSFDTDARRSLNVETLDEQTTEITNRSIAVLESGSVFESASELESGSIALMMRDTISSNETFVV